MSLVAQLHVCIKEAVDWNTSTKDFRIDTTTNEPVVSFARFQIDQYDEIALEVALRARAACGLTVHALSVGSALTEDCLKHAYSMSADAATLIEQSTPPVCKIALLAAAIGACGPDFVALCGLMSSRGGSGATGPRLAESLGVPCIANVIALERSATGWRLWREIGDDLEQLEITSSFVATVTNAQSNRPRVPNMKDRMRGFRQAIATLTPLQLGVSAGPADGDATRVLRRYVEHSSRQCRMVEGSAADKAQAIAASIRRVLPRFG